MGIDRKRNSVILVLIVVFIFQSCTDTIIWSENKVIEESVWKPDEKINFSFSIADTISPKNLFITLRNTNNYEFSNLYIITELNYPNGNKVVDTLQYEMTDESGKFLGHGTSNLKENKLYYKENLIFPNSGDYTVSIRQAMRKNGEVNPIELKGIQDIGMSLEKIKE